MTIKISQDEKRIDPVTGELRVLTDDEVFISTESGIGTGSLEDDPMAALVNRQLWGYVGDLYRSREALREQGLPEEEILNKLGERLEKMIDQTKRGEGWVTPKRPEGER